MLLLPQNEKTVVPGRITRRFPIILFDINNARTVAYGVLQLDSRYLRAYRIKYLPGLEHCRQRQIVTLETIADVEKPTETRILAVHGPYSQAQLESYFSFANVRIDDIVNGSAIPRTFTAFGITGDDHARIVLKESYFSQGSCLDGIQRGTIVRCLPVEPTTKQVREGKDYDKGAFARVVRY